MRRRGLRWRHVWFHLLLLRVVLYPSAASGQLTLASSGLDFGSVQEGSSSTLSTSVTNTSRRYITISQASASGTGFSFSGPSLPIILAPDQSISLSVTFTPQATGPASGSLSVVTIMGFRAWATTQASTISLSGSGTGNTIGSPPAIASTTTASGTVGSQFSYQITATNSPTSYAATGLPTGLSVNTSTGLISGTPTVAGTSTVTVSATNSGGTGSASLTLTINSAAPVITSSTTVNGAVGSAFSYQITATNSPTSYAATGLPTGLSVNTSTGLISGTPTISGTSSATINATNAGGTGSATLTLGIASTSYSVMLSWTASPSPDAAGYEISGYNIFRSTTSGGPYTQLNSSLIAGTTYADTTVADGTTYYYVATVVDSSNAQSGYSTQIEAVVP
jgi:Putative Ig domain/Abnormal spindle-like microcephaly-assoc'd, ASPM-SPD-2-Hydin